MWGHCVPDGCGLGLGKLGWVMAHLAVAHKLAPPVCWAPTTPWPLGHSSWACVVDCCCGAGSSRSARAGFATVGTKGEDVCNGQGLAPWWEMLAWLGLDFIQDGRSGWGGWYSSNPRFVHPAAAVSCSLRASTGGCGSQGWDPTLFYPLRVLVGLWTGWDNHPTSCSS